MNAGVLSFSSVNNGVVEISDTKNGNDYKVNGQRIKSFLELVPVNETALGLLDPMYR